MRSSRMAPSPSTEQAAHVFEMHVIGMQVTKFARAMVRRNEDRSEAAITLGSEHSFHVANGMPLLRAGMQL